MLGRVEVLVAFIKKQLTITRIPNTITFTSMQVLELSLSIYSKKYTLIIIYRPEPVQKHWYTMTTFFKELNILLSNYNMLKSEIIIMGDFNIHVNNKSCQQ